MKGLELSEIGETLFENARLATLAEMRDFNRVRTRVYYPVSAGESASLELRTLIEDVAGEFNFDLSRADRNAKYFKVIHARVMDLLEMKIHRLSPDSYIVVTRRPDGQVVFIVRDKTASLTDNIKVLWADDSLSSCTLEKIPFHATREVIELSV